MHEPAVPAEGASARADLNQMHAGVCKAIADPKRLLIITALRDGERSVSELCDVVDTSQSNASQHLSVLRDRGIVQGRRDGTTIYYRLTSPLVLDAIDLLREFVQGQATGAGSRIGAEFLG